MTEAHDTYKSIYQNLIDAGCDESITEKCMLLVKEERIFDMLPILANHRKHLLDSVHKGQKQIDCLDYLIYSLKKQK
ncbi:hypothetical protein CLOSTMETH_01284 [[Clostridium] methylpentosum DSM 5476]|uniref:Uncharacterized protein n=1 Tax=[Clostridium] methylpentosum DSM 5476 TaxID=537013 RepID=C0EBR6_9FIRM|nr:hypothetical protein CLOSTMETH_01284 [[Clostridium] methylpentosum DSM 5476]MEE1492579.1 hypothetical protein [Massilioclostridium sp.]